MIKVIVAGGRHFSDYLLLKEKLLFYLQRYEWSDVEVVSGAAKGADALGERFGKEMGCKVKRFPADWDQYKKSAGYIRNQQMAEYADICVVFWDGESKGSKHMIDLAKKHKIPLRVVRY